MRDGKSIPSERDIISSLDSFLRSSVLLGSPLFQGYKQGNKQRSNPDLYNQNIDDARFDVETFNIESLSQIMRILRNFSASEIQTRNLSVQLDDIINQATAAAYFRNGYSYVVSDSFSDTSKVDQYRSTTTTDLTDGKITLLHGIRSTIDHSFLLSEINAYNLSFSRRVLSKVPTPGSKFGNIFDGTSSYWNMRVMTEIDGDLEMSFEIPLSNDGSSVDINGIYIEALNHDRSKFYVEYMIGNSWHIIVDDELRTKGRFSFPSVRTNRIRITSKKTTSDNKIGSRYIYEFGIRSILFYLSSSKSSGTFYSTSLKLQDSDEKNVPGVMVDLVVDQYLPQDTAIDYYVAADPYISGTFETSGALEVDPYDYGTEGIVWSNDLSSFYPSTTLRDFSISGWFGDYSTWEPNWISITPSTTDGSQTGSPVYLDFASFVDPDETLNGFPEEVSIYGTWGNVGLFKIFEFKDNFDSTKYPTPSDIRLHAGKNCFRFTEEFYEYKEEITSQGLIIDGRLTIYGTSDAAIVYGSIKNLRTWGVNPENSAVHFQEKEDYVVNYGVPNAYSAEIVQNAGKINVIAEDSLPVQFEYIIKRKVSYYTYQTSFYYDENQYKESVLNQVTEPVITIYWWTKEGFGRMKSVVLTNYNEFGGIVDSRTELEKAPDEVVKIDIRTVGSGRGWYTLKAILEFDSEEPIVCVLTEAGVGIPLLESTIEEFGLTENTTVTTTKDVKPIGSRLDGSPDVKISTVERSDATTKTIAITGTSPKVSGSTRYTGGKIIAPVTTTSDTVTTNTKESIVVTTGSTTPFASSAPTKVATEVVPEDDAPDNTITIDFVTAVFTYFQPKKRFLFPDFITKYAWRQPCLRVTEDYLKYRVHKFDHLKFCVIKQNSGYYAVISNNAGQFSGNNRLVYQGVPISPTDGLLGKDLAEFYEIKYNLSSTKFDSLLLKAVLRGTNDSSPELRGYTLRITG